MSSKRISLLAALFAVGAMNVIARGEEPKNANPAAPAAVAASNLVGKPAPDFTGTDLDGKTHTLADFKGKTVVVEWFSSKCPFCKAHVKDKKTMQSTFAKFKEKNVVWIAVDSNVAEIAAPKDIAAFAKECGITYPIILDPDGKIGHAFGAKTTPHMFIIDKNGVIAYEGAIDSDATGKSPEITNYVDAALQSLVDGSEVATKSTKPYGCSVKYGAPAGEEKKEKGGHGNG